MSDFLESKKFYVIGLNYQKANVVTRSNFSLSKKKQKKLFQAAKENGIDSLVVLSTCNRTEIIGFSEHPYQLISLLCEFSKGSIDEFSKASYVYKNSEAAEHVIRIATGLESQILGDYEIISQLKQAIQFAKKHDVVNAYLERLFNIALQASKEVKNKTSLSSGITTASYAAIQYVKNNFADFSNKKILIYGLGDIGTNIAKSCVSYLQNNPITIINRTEEKALALAKVLNLTFAKHCELENKIQESDVIIVATGSSSPTVIEDYFINDKKQLIIDLSIPANVALPIKELDNKEVVDVDMLSDTTKATLENRKKQIPLVEEIIAKYKNEFYEWISFRRSTPAISSFKKSLIKIQQETIEAYKKKNQGAEIEHLEKSSSLIVKKMVSKFAAHLKDNNTQAKQSIQVVREIFELK